MSISTRQHFYLLELDRSRKHLHKRSNLNVLSCMEGRPAETPPIFPQLQPFS